MAELKYITKKDNQYKINRVKKNTKRNIKRKSKYIIRKVAHVK